MVTLQFLNEHNISNKHKFYVNNIVNWLTYGNCTKHLEISRSV